MAEARHDSWGDVPVVGAPVFTRDGHWLGDVKEVRGPYFKVAVPLHPDYWLQRSIVHQGADGRLTTKFKRRENHAYHGRDIDGALADLGGDRSDEAHLGESGTETDTAIDRSGAP